MERIIDDAHVEPVVRVLLGAIDAGDGGTAEQRSVLRAVVDGYWERPDLDLAALDPIDPDGAAAAVTGPGQRRRVREFMAMLELCRHPLTEAQVQRVDAYAAALGEEGPGLQTARDIARDQVAKAVADYARRNQETFIVVAEQSLVDRYLTLDAPDAELSARVHALHDLPEGSLGWEYVEFYRRNGFVLPGDNPASPAFFMGHDMTHVIAGYGTSGEGEVCLSAFQLTMADTDVHWSLLLASLCAYECGFSSNDTFEGKYGVLGRPGAPEMLAEAFRRGAQCTGDFSVVDHFALAPLPLEEVRAMFGVPPLVGRDA